VSRQGVLLVLAGPSGAGKGTVGSALLARDPRLHWSVSWATRPPRPGEVDGVHYHFRDRAEFERLRDAGGFLEAFEVFGDLKGTPSGPVVEWLDAGDDVLCEVDVQGALAIRRQHPDALLVFIRAPSRAVQRERLERRAQDQSDAIERRLAEADAEEAVARESFDAVVVNDDLGRAVDEVAAILERHRAELGERPS
jgi:guanylate kinase